MKAKWVQLFRGQLFNFTWVINFFPLGLMDTCGLETVAAQRQETINIEPSTSKDACFIYAPVLCNEASVHTHCFSVGKTGKTGRQLDLPNFISAKVKNIPEKSLIKIYLCGEIEVILFDSLTSNPGHSVILVTRKTFQNSSVFFFVFLAVKTQNLFK